MLTILLNYLNYNANAPICNTKNDPIGVVFSVGSGKTSYR